MPEYNLDPVFAQSCHCNDCEAAVSPLAYFADLLKYTLDVIKGVNGASLVPVDYDFIEHNFRQSFKKIPFECHELESKICQARFAIETLRKYQSTVDTEQISTYLDSAYQSLLAIVGLNLNTLRLIQGAPTADKMELAKKLGFKYFKNDNIDTFQRLYLYTGGSGIYQLNETNIERLFGLVDTTRNPYATGTAWGDSGSLISRWNFQGINWQINTDLNGYLFLDISGDTTLNYKVYRKSTKLIDDLVAEGSMLLSAYVEGIVVDLFEKNHSGLSGYLVLSDDGTSSAISFNVIPEVLCWKYQKTADDWEKQDHEFDTLGFPIVDPDVVTIEDIRNPYETFVTPAASPIQFFLDRKQDLDTKRKTISEAFEDIPASSNYDLAEGVVTVDYAHIRFDKNNKLFTVRQETDDSNDIFIYGYTFSASVYAYTSSASILNSGNLETPGPLFPNNGKLYICNNGTSLDSLAIFDYNTEYSSLSFDESFGESSSIPWRKYEILNNPSDVIARDNFVWLADTYDSKARIIRYHIASSYDNPDLVAVPVTATTVTDAYGNSYNIEGNIRIEKKDINGKLIWTLGKKNKDGDYIAGSKDGEFTDAVSINIGTDGYIYISDEGDAPEGIPARIIKINSEGKFISKTTKVADLDEARDIYSNALGNIYIANTGEGVVLVLDNNGVVQFSIELPAPTTGSRKVEFVSADEAGNIFIGDSLQKSIFKYGPDGQLLFEVKGESGSTTLFSRLDDMYLQYNSDGEAQYLYVLVKTLNGSNQVTAIELVKLDTSGTLVTKIEDDGFTIDSMSRIYVDTDGAIYLSADDAVRRGVPQTNGTYTWTVLSVKYYNGSGYTAFSDLTVIKMLSKVTIEEGEGDEEDVITIERLLLVDLDGGKFILSGGIQAISSVDTFVADFGWGDNYFLNMPDVCSMAIHPSGELLTISDTNDAAKYYRFYLPVSAQGGASSQPGKLYLDNEGKNLYFTITSGGTGKGPLYQTGPDLPEPDLSLLDILINKNISYLTVDCDNYLYTIEDGTTTKKLVQYNLANVAQTRVVSPSEQAFETLAIDGNKRLHSKVNGTSWNINVISVTSGLAETVNIAFDQEYSFADINKVNKFLTQGIDVKPNLQFYGFDIVGYAFLQQLNLLASNGASLLETEKEQFFDLLTNTYKHWYYYSDWKTEEAAKDITLSPLFFNVLNNFEENEITQTQWRATYKQRRAWREILLGRKEFIDGLRDNLTENVASVEDSELPKLRDGLIALLTGSSFTGKDISERADILTNELLLDYKDNCCSPTNRISLSIEILQKFLEGVRNGFITQKEFYISSAWTTKNVLLNDDAFDNSWQLLSSYANWRPAMFVHMYPENLLLPSLRRQQSSAFRKITDGVFSNDRFSPSVGVEMASQYGEYLKDISNLDIQASCIAFKPRSAPNPPPALTRRVRARNRIIQATSSRTPIGNSTSQFNPDDSAKVSRVETLFMFAQSRVTQKVYWTCLDAKQPIDLAYRDWNLLLENTQIVKVIGATSVTLYDNNRRILVILKIRKEGKMKIASLSYDITQQIWDEECTELDFESNEEKWTDFEAHFSNPQNSDLPVRMILTRLPDNRIFGATISKKGDDFTAKQSLLNLDLILKPLIEQNIATVQQQLNEYRGDGFNTDSLVSHFTGTFQAQIREFKKYNVGQALAYYRIYSDTQKAKLDLPDYVKTYFNFDIYGQNTQRLLFVGEKSEKLSLFEINEVKGGKIMFPVYFPVEPDPTGGIDPDFLKKNTFINFVSVFETNELITFWSDQITGNVSVYLIKKDTGTPAKYISKKIVSTGFTKVKNISLAPFTDAYSYSSEHIPLVVNKISSGGANQVCKGMLKLTISGGTTTTAVELLDNAENPVVPLTPFVTGPVMITPSPEQNKMQDYVKENSYTLLSSPANANGYLKTYIQELYYFMPMTVAWQLQQKGYYTEALDWYRLVYDYTKSVAQRKIYYGLKEEETLSKAFTRPSNWMIDPIDPHGVASDRINAYTRFTVSSIVLCLIQYGDNEFTKDTVETVAQARQLYMEAVDMLNTPGITYSDTYAQQQAQLKLLNEFDDIFVDDGYGNKAVLLPIWTQLKSECSLVKNLSTLTSLVDDIETIMGALSNPDPEAVLTELGLVQVLISEVLTDQETPQDSVTRQAANNDARNRAHQLVMADDQVTMNILTIAQTAENAFANNISASSGIQVATLQAGTISLIGGGTPSLLSTSFLSAEANYGNLIVNTGAVQSELLVPTSGTVAADNFNPGFVSLVAYSSTFVNAPSVTNLVNLADVNRFVSADAYIYPYSLAGNSFSYCIPRNPVPDMYRMYAEMNLYKLRNCLNIAGIKRELDPFSAPTDSSTGLPYIGVNGQIVFPGSAKFFPSQYRYEVLIERAKQLCALAQQMEAAMFTAMEKFDAEKFSELQAKQQVKLTKESLKVNNLKIKYAEGEIKLAELSVKKAQAQVDHYSDLISAGTSPLEYAALGMLQAASAMFAVQAASPTSVATHAFTSSKNAAGNITGVSSSDTTSTTSPSYSFGQSIATQASVFSMLASFERRKQEWDFAREMGQFDVSIGQQQVRQATTGLRIASQEYRVADMQVRNNEETLNFIRTKFTNAALYSWMSQTLGRVYSWFLQQATAIAIQAQNQLAFERQENPQGFVKTDYWDAPVDPNEQKSPDRKGLAGSARLLQDIYQLDQYAFSTDVRKLNLTKTFSLANLAPAEFEEFKRTGQIQFATLASDFDRDFPGHYLRQVKQVRTSVIALTNPIDGIKSTLSSSGRSYIVTKAGMAFQRIPINNKPAESVALTGAQNATGVFEMQYANANNGKLMPFEGMGVETMWNFTLPKASNAFDFNTIADVQITMDYTAMDSFEYRQQVLKEMGTDYKNARGYSLRFDFPDQWFDLNNNTGVKTIITLPFRRGDFPVNLIDMPLISAISFYYSCNDVTAEMTISNFSYTAFTDSGTTVLKNLTGGTSIKHMLSSRQGAGEWANMISKSVSGDLELVIDDPATLKAFTKGLVQDVLVMISYRGELPAYPSSI